MGRLGEGKGGSICGSPGLCDEGHRLAANEIPQAYFLLVDPSSIALGIFNGDCCFATQDLADWRILPLVKKLIGWGWNLA